MNENEIMVNEEVIEEPEVVEENDSGMSTGLAMLIGSGLTLAVIAGVKQGKKIMAKIKAKKEAAKATEDSEVIDVTDEAVVEDAAE